jgi:hypothetical protein
MIPLTNVKTLSHFVHLGNSVVNYFTFRKLSANTTQCNANTPI